MADDEANESGDLYERGLAVRREHLGSEHVDAALKASDDFMMKSQRMTTEWCWGYVWGRPGLDRKTRSMLTIAILTALNRSDEIAAHVRAAMQHGLTEEELSEVLLHATVYCGVPAGRDAFRKAQEGIRAAGAEADRG